MADSPDVRLVVISLSESFRDFWPILAGEVGTLVEPWRPEDAPTAAPGAAAVIVAAGGREEDLPDFVRGLHLPSDLPVLAVGALASHRLAARTVAGGAADYFVLPEDRDGLHDALAAAVARHRAAWARAALGRLEAQAHAFREIVGDSPALKATLERAARVVPHADATVLITGETGTGKELVARALHYGGPRAAAPFVELNCAALPPQLLESELFGHERGAFTDARTAKPGLFEVAEGGTLFLDEIHQLALDLQAKLLRGLEQKSVRRLGATTSRTFDVRIVAACNADLAAEVRAGRIREDLYYRLNVVTLELPPLRERGDDVLRLAEFFVRRFGEQYHVPQPPLTPEVRGALLAHAWPGNVRELRNTVERGILLSPPGTLTLEELAPRPAAASPAAAGGIPFPARLADIQRSAARAMLAATDGNRSEAARRLGISRSRLQRLLSAAEGGDEDDAE
ncbi:MAG: sigma-54 interaction domain-containing protein [Gemmatimonadales bacterium]